MGNRKAREFMRRKADESAWERGRTEPRPAHDDIRGGRGIGSRRLQLIIAPSFEDVSVWEVRERGDEWQLVRPLVAAREPVLMVVGHELVPFASSALAAYFERVTAIHLPLRPDLSSLGGADGTMYELAVFGDLHSEWRFRWWSRAPEQWQPLVGLAAEMQTAFTAAWEPNCDPDRAPDSGQM